MLAHRTDGRIVRFGAFELDLSSGELRKGGVRVRLQDQPLRILLALLRSPGEIVSRETLRRQLWPDGTFVDFEHSLNAAVRRLRTALGDEGEVPRFIETVHRRGYRFLVFDDGFAPHLVEKRRGSPATIAHIARARARLAVVPFGPQDIFSEGLTEEAVTQLARVCPRHIGVIARTSVERARRDAASTVEIGRALAADYLLEGSVRRDGERLRVTAHLIESEDETHLWATTYDRVLTDALSVQSDLAEQIAKEVSDALSRAQL